MRILVRSIERINWDKPNPESASEAADLLRQVGPERLLRIGVPIIAQLVRDGGRIIIDPESSSQHIRITPTYEKYLLYGEHSENDGVKLWGHHWTTAWRTSVGLPCYAEIDHRHRYNIAAGPARGKYVMTSRLRKQDKYGDLPPDGLWIPTMDEWNHPEVRTFEPGDTWSLSTHDIHNIAPDEGAFSFVIQGPTQYHYSHTFVMEAGSLVINSIPGLTAAYERMISRLRS